MQIDPRDVEAQPGSRSFFSGYSNHSLGYSWIQSANIALYIGQINLSTEIKRKMEKKKKGAQPGLEPGTTSKLGYCSRQISGGVRNHRPKEVSDH